MATPALGRPQRIRFGVFELDPRAGEIYKCGRRIRLAQQPLQVLVALLEHAGEMVSREELRRRLWPGDTYVDFDHGLNNAINRLREILGDTAGKPRFIETIPRRGYRFLARVEAAGGETQAPATSVLVLPFRNLSGDAGQDYFADGMTDALISSLAPARALRVVSCTTAMHYRGTRKSLPEIARELQVDYVVEGSVARAGGQVRITAQLIEAAHEGHLWAAQYQKQATDVLAVQADVAEAITRELRVTLSAAELTRVRARRGVNSESYDLYLRGRFFWNQRTREGLAKALQLFEESAGKDAGHAASHSGIAECRNMLAYWGFERPAETFPAARRAAEKSLALDAHLAEAHAARAWPLMAYARDWREARHELQLALRENPVCVTAHLWLGHYCTYRGEHEEALASVRRALELDPVSVVATSNAAFVLFMARQFEAAEEQARRAVEMDASFFPPHFWLGRACEQLRKFEEAVAELRQASALSGGAAVAEAAQAHALASAGDGASARAIVDRLQTRAQQEYVSAYYMAAALATFDQGKALPWLQAACAEHSSWLVKARVDPWLDALRSERGFAAILVAAGLAD